MCEEPEYGNVANESLYPLRPGFYCSLSDDCRWLTQQAEGYRCINSTQSHLESLHQHVIRP